MSLGDGLIHFSFPYSLSKNLGEQYNYECNHTEKNYIAFLDGDAMFLCSDWGHKLEQVIKDNPDGDIFGCTTNRLRHTHQLFENRISEETDIMEHKRISDLLWRNCGTSCIDTELPLAGVLLLFRKEVWNKIKFKDGIIAVDKMFCNEAVEAGYKLKIMSGIYVLHFYRMDKKITDINHLL